MVKERGDLKCERETTKKGGVTSNGGNQAERDDGLRKQRLGEQKKKRKEIRYGMTIRKEERVRGGKKKVGGVSKKKMQPSFVLFA